MQAKDRKINKHTNKQNKQKQTRNVSTQLASEIGVMEVTKRNKIHTHTDEEEDTQTPARGKNKCRLLEFIHPSTATSRRYLPDPPRSDGATA